MTAARTPSQRGRSNRNKGLTAERDLCKWLRANGFGGAERAVRTGFRVGDRVSADPGDVTGTPGVVWSVKYVAVEQTAAWLAEVDAMLKGGDADYGLLIVKRRGHADPGEWWCWLRFCDLVGIEAATRSRIPVIYCGHSAGAPVRMELGHVVPLLRAAGYGTPMVVAS